MCGILTFWYTICAQPANTHTHTHKHTQIHRHTRDTHIDMYDVCIRARALAHHSRTILFELFLVHHLCPTSKHAHTHTHTHKHTRKYTDIHETHTDMYDVCIRARTLAHHSRIILFEFAGQHVYIYWYGTPRPNRRKTETQKHGVWYKAAIRGFNQETGEHRVRYQVGFGMGFILWLSKWPFGACMCMCECVCMCVLLYVCVICVYMCTCACAAVVCVRIKNFIRSLQHPKSGEHCIRYQGSVGRGFILESEEHRVRYQVGVGMGFILESEEHCIWYQVGVSKGFILESEEHRVRYQVGVGRGFILESKEHRARYQGGVGRGFILESEEHYARYQGGVGRGYNLWVKATSGLQ